MAPLVGTCRLPDIQQPPTAASQGPPLSDTGANEKGGNGNIPIQEPCIHIIIKEWFLEYMHSRKLRAISMFIARAQYPIYQSEYQGSRSQLPSKTVRNTTSEHKAKNKLTRRTKALNSSGHQEDEIPEIKASSALPEQSSSGDVVCLTPSSQRSMLVHVIKK
ncbi:hypothetical protein ARMSODRAFT_1004132, partial [Armillaria solidipes]